MYYELCPCKLLPTHSDIEMHFVENCDHHICVDRFSAWIRLIGTDFWAHHRERTTGIYTTISPLICVQLSCRQYSFGRGEPKATAETYDCNVAAKRNCDNHMLVWFESRAFHFVVTSIGSFASFAGPESWSLLYHRWYVHYIFVLNTCCPLASSFSFCSVHTVVYKYIQPSRNSHISIAFTWALSHRRGRDQTWWSWFVSLGKCRSPPKIREKKLTVQFVLNIWLRFILDWSNVNAEREPVYSSSNAYQRSASQ